MGASIKEYMLHISNSWESFIKLMQYQALRMALPESVCKLLPAPGWVGMGKKVIKALGRRPIPRHHAGGNQRVTVNDNLDLCGERVKQSDVLYKLTRLSEHDLVKLFSKGRKSEKKIG